MQAAAAPCLDRCFQAAARMRRITAPRQAFHSARKRRPARLENLVGTYSHFGELFSSRPVQTRDDALAVQAGARAADLYNFGSERLSIEDYLGRNPATGLLIAKDDTILYEHYQYARTDPTASFRSRWPRPSPRC